MKKKTQKNKRQILFLNLPYLNQSPQERVTCIFQSPSHISSQESADVYTTKSIILTLILRVVLGNSPLPQGMDRFMETCVH